MKLYHVVEIFNLDSAEAGNQEHLGELQRHWLNLGHTLTVAEHLSDFSSDMEDDVCENMGDNPLCLGASLGLLCIPNPPRIACNIASLVNLIISYAILIGVTIAYQAVDDIFEIATLGELYQLSLFPTVM